MTLLDLKQVFAPVKLLFQYVSHTTLFGFLPLDIVAHIFIGFLIFRIMIHLRFRIVTTLVTIFLLEFLKELYDSTTLVNDMTEHLKDFFFTFVYPGYFILSLKLRKRKASRSPESSR